MGNLTKKLSVKPVANSFKQDTTSIILVNVQVDVHPPQILGCVHVAMTTHEIWHKSTKLGCVEGYCSRNVEILLITQSVILG